MKCNGVHHFYLGVTVATVGFFGLFTKCPGVLCFLISLAGLIIMADDIWQHYRQQKNPGYKSPLAAMFEKYLWKYKIVRTITEFFDKLLGAK